MHRDFQYHKRRSTSKQMIDQITPLYLFIYLLHTGLMDGSNTQSSSGRKASPQLSLTSGILHAGNAEIQIAGEYAQVRVG